MWKYVIGYVIINVEGLNLEKFLNLCAENGIVASDVRRIEYSKIQATVTTPDFFKLSRLKIGLSVSIKQKGGLLAAIKILKFRFMLLLGGIICFFALNYLASFIQKIDIAGDLKVSKDAILAQLEESGTAVGVAKKNIDLRDIERKLEMSELGISFAGARFNGTKLTIEIIHESNDVITDNPNGYDIVASKDGVISKLTVLGGMPKMQEGKRVKKGEILIATSRGEDERYPDIERYVSAKGEALARVWYNGEASIKKSQTAWERTGQYVEKSRIVMGKIDYQPYISEYKKYDVIEINENQITNSFIPLSIIDNRYYELIETPVSLSEEVIKSMAEEAAFADATKFIDQNAKIVDTVVNYTDTGDSVRAVIVIEAIENIGTLAPMQLESAQEEN